MRITMNDRIALMAAVSLAALIGCTTLTRDEAPIGQTFDSPDAAAEAMLSTLGAERPEALLAILGTAYRDQLITSDWNYGQEERLEIVARSREKLSLDYVADDTVELIIGPDEWPFPILLERADGRWHFDTEDGLEELISRRVGRNELTAIALLGAYVDAQIDYALEDHDGDGRLEYAQRIVSSAGQHDGLYWPDEDGSEQSPFGPLVERAERYLDTTEPGDPFFGYYLNILTRRGPQGTHPGYDYVADGNMTRGFAMVAYPADYGITGVMTFVVNQSGVVYQKDLGPFEGMTEYAPDDSWKSAAD